MDLKQLEYFCAVAELNSFTRASQLLDVAQPALSRQVRQLEVELRQPLLLRNGRGATPTEAGKRLLAHARGILHQVARAQEDLAALRGEPSGRVTVGLPNSVARTVAVPLMRAFAAASPQARLSITEGLSASLLEGLQTGRLDIAVLYNAQPAADVELQPLADEALLLVQRRPPGLAEDPPPGPIALAALAQIPLVIASRPNALRMHVESSLAALGLRAQVAMEIDGVSAILDLVADGAGAAVLSANAVAHSLRPSAYQTRAITQANGAQPWTIGLWTAISARRPSTPSQASALALLTELASSSGRRSTLVS